MTRFQDGPAKGQVLMLRRAAMFLRVTEAAGKFDALDQLGDTPAPNEKLYAYAIAEQPAMSFVRMSGGRGGAYPIATYKFVTPQPTDAEMRGEDAWAAWTQKQPKPI